MDDATAEAQQARVMALYEKWGPPLGLGYQREIRFSWLRGPIPDYSDAAMVCTAQWEYKSAGIGVDLTQVATLGDKELEWALVHELCHVFLGGLKTAFNKRVDGDAFGMIEEHTASTLAQAFLWLRAYAEQQPPIPEPLAEVGG